MQGLRSACLCSTSGPTATALPQVRSQQLGKIRGASGRECVVRARRAFLEASEEEINIADRRADSASDTDMASIKVVQWFPGHIARAERMLREQLTMVDIILEVRDARCILSTEHPQLETWAQKKPRLLVLNRVDMISAEDKAAWQRYFDRQRLAVFWTDGKSGDGVQGMMRAVRKVAATINRRRERMGLRPRSVRLVAIGFPNVGKSALLNRLAGRRIYDSAPKPGVTRALKWVRLGDDVDLLDAPGVLPMRFDDQIAAARLCMVNNIGEASYVQSLIAAALVARLRALGNYESTRAAMCRRWGIPVEEEEGMTCEEVVEAVAANLFHGDSEKAAARMLKDFRTLALGPVALETPPADM